MGAIFKPSPLEWGDVEGGVGEATLEEIDNFIYFYCDEYREKPIEWENEELGTSLALFAENWERHIADGGWGCVTADRKQAIAILSLINGSFFTSMARDTIAEALEKSATKHNLVEIITTVTALYCEYITLKAAVEAEEEKGTDTADGY